MYSIIVLMAILQGAAISLGMGSSTLAIINFFVAIADGKIEPEERKMMSVVYIVLRIAMVLILVTTVSIIANNYFLTGASSISTFTISQLTIISVLFINAVLMTERIMPSTIGPAIQAGSWYSLGIMTSLLPLGLTNFTFGQFLLGYVTALILTICIVNAVMASPPPPLRWW